jgi:uncharacterized protein
MDARAWSGPVARVTWIGMESLLITVLAGAIFGAGAGILLLTRGRIAGFSGITAGLLEPQRGDVAWRILFMAGVLAGGAVGSWVFPGSIVRTSTSSSLALIAAGLCIGVGARLANGCTSGHGVCGVGRLSPRSMVAVVTFTVSGAMAYAVRSHVLGFSS